MDTGYGNYEPEPREYYPPPQYTDRQYNNYPSEYEMDNIYEKKSYRNNYYEQPREYSSYQSDYKQEYPSNDKDDRYKSKKDSISINKLNCINTNFINIGNINGSINTFAPDRTADSEGDLGASSLGWNEEGYDNGYNKQKEKGFTCIINNNINTTIGGGNATTPIPPEPPITSLTVNKEIFGCDNIRQGADPRMDCLMQNNSPDWLPCIDSAISNTVFCQRLPASLFDIEVLDDQNIQIQEFEGSTEGTTIQNLEPGTYTVNETKVQNGLANPNTANQLVENVAVQQGCIGLGFDGGGILFRNPDIPNQAFYNICFEYEDEQGNDCSTVTLAAGEEKTCTAKNYILNAVAQGSDTIAQGIGDSSELTAMEKTTKLKQQWLELLP